MTSVRRWVAMGVAIVLPLAACGGDDDAGDGGDGESGAVADADDSSSGDDNSGDASSGDGGSSAAGGGGGGTLVLGDETIALDSARCFLQEQDAAAGGGKILFVAQGFGTNGAGDELVVDVSRYDEDSQFTGDDILVDIGDPFSEDAVSLQAGGDIGTVTVDGSTLSADGLTFQNFDDATEQPGSFQINC